MTFFRTLFTLSLIALLSSGYTQEETTDSPPPTGDSPLDTAAVSAPVEEVKEAPVETAPEQITTETPTTSPEPTPQPEPQVSAQEEEKPIKKEIKGIVTDEEIAPIKTKLKKKSKEETNPEVFVNQADKVKLPSNYKYIDLNTAIEQGLRENLDEKSRVLQSEILDLDLKGAQMSFWLPNVQLQMMTNPQLIGRLKRGTKPGPGSDSSASGAVGLSLGDYTIFNWGKDYLSYLNKNREVKRDKEILGEEKRDLRHKIIFDYFNLVTAKNAEKIARNGLRQASFLFRFNKERVAIGKASKQEYFEARAQYLKAQAQYQKVVSDIEVLEEQLSTTIQEPHGISYYIGQELLFKRITVPLDEALGFGKAKNAGILTAKNKVEIANSNYELAIKESLPLPKVSINLGAYTNSFSKNGSRTIYETNSDNSDLEIVASVNATWDILGSRGFLNGNEREKSYLQKELALRRLTQSKEQTEEAIREYYKRILSSEKLYLIAEAQAANLQKNFDNLLDSYVNKHADFNDLRKALDELTEGQLSFEQVKLEHLRNKIYLAQAMGMEDLPGESFDKLVTGSKQK